MTGPNVVSTRMVLCRRGRQAEVVTGRRCTTCGWSTTDPAVDPADDEGVLFGAAELRAEHTAEQCEQRRTR